MDIVIVAVVVTIAAPQIQELDQGNNATFLFGQNTTLLISRYKPPEPNDSYVKSHGMATLGVNVCKLRRIDTFNISTVG